MSQGINDREIISRNDGFAIVSDKTVLISNDVGSYYVNSNKSNTYRSLVDSFKSINGIDITHYTISPKLKLFILGNPSATKNSFKLLAGMFNGMKLDMGNSDISNIVDFPYDELSTRDEDRIARESKEISQIVTKSISSHKVIEKTPTMTPIRKTLVFIIAISLLSLPATYTPLASAYYNGCADRAIIEGNLDDAADCNFKVKELNVDSALADARFNKINYLSDHIGTNDQKLNSKNLADKGDEFVESRNCDTALAFYYLAYLKNNENTRGLNGIGYCIQTIETSEFKKLHLHDELPVKDNSKNSISQAYFNKVIQIYSLDNDPFNGVSNAYNGLGDIATKNKNYQQAASFYELVLELFGSDKSEYSESELIVVHSSRSNSYLGKGGIEMAQLNYDKTIEYFLKSNKILNNTKTLNALGDIHFRDNQPIKSKEYYVKSLNLTDVRANNIDAIIGLSLVHLELGDDVKSFDLLQEAKEYDGTVIFSILNLAEELINTKNYDKAQVALDIILLSESSGHALVLYGLIDAKQNRMNDAFDKFEKALKIDAEVIMEDLLEIATDFDESGKKDESNRLIELSSQYGQTNIGVQ